MLQVFSDEMVTGGIIITITAALSLFILLLTLLHILLAFVLPSYAQLMSSPQERKFVRSPLGFYIISLFVSNIVSAMGGVMQIRWIDAGAITQGPACSSQAFMLQLGSNATALWIGVISISALRTFMFRARPLSRMATVLLICTLWTAMILFDALASIFFANHSGNFFYGVAFLWCWITPNHRAARLVTQYVWMWVWSLVSAVCSLLVFLSVRGNIKAKRGGPGRIVRWSKRAIALYAQERGDEQYGTLVGTVGKTMCWFSVSYITLTLPISVSRVLETFGFQTPVNAFVFSAICFLLLGVNFPILYFAICHSLKHASTWPSSRTTLCEDIISGETFQNSKETPILPFTNRYSYPSSSTSSTHKRGSPLLHQDIGEATNSSSTMISGGEERMFNRKSDAPQKRLSVIFQLVPGVRSLHRPMGSTSTITSSGTLVGPMQFPPILKGTSVNESNQSQLTLPPAAVVVPRQPQQVKRDLQLNLDKNTALSFASGSALKSSDTDAASYTKPRAISPDLNALLLTSQIPLSPFGPPPPPRKIRRVPILSVPVDVDESDEGSVLSALQTIGVSSPDYMQHISQECHDSMRTFWAAYEGKTLLTPLSPNAASKRDTARTFGEAYEYYSPAAADILMTPDGASFRSDSMLNSNIISPDTPHFQRFDPSVSLRPSLSAFGGTHTSFGVFGNRQQLRNSASMSAPLRSSSTYI